MAREKKLKQLFDLLKVEKAVEERLQRLILESVVELTEKDTEELRKFLLDTIIANLTKFLTSRFSEDEMAQVVSYYSNKKLLETLTRYDRLVLQAVSKTELDLQEFLHERDLMKQARATRKKDLN